MPKNSVCLFYTLFIIHSKTDRYFLIGKNKIDRMANSSNKDAYDEIFASLEKHNKWFENSIP